MTTATRYPEGARGGRLFTSWRQTQSRTSLRYGGSAPSRNAHPRGASGGSPTAYKPFTAQDKADILALHESQIQSRTKIEYLLVLRSQGRRFALLVDHVLGREEIVVQNRCTRLSKELGSSPEQH